MDGEMRSWRPQVTPTGISRQSTETTPANWTTLCDQGDVQDLIHSYLRIDEARLRAAALAAVRALSMRPTD